MSTAAPTSRPDGPRWIITFSLWGDAPKYVQGALDNARIAAEVFPGWTCRFYVGSSVPAGAVAELQKLPGAEVVQMDEPGDLRGALWRFRAAEDAEVLLLRDADCRLSFPEKAAVDAWLASGLQMHTFGHYALGNMLASTTGLRGQAVRDLARELADWTPQDYYGNDEDLLRGRLLPGLRRNGQILMHEHSWGYGDPYPRPMADGSDLGLVWQADALFAQTLVPLLLRDPGFLRTWYRRWGAAVCRGVRSVHRPGGLWLAWLLWRLLYGPPAPLVQLGGRLRVRWRRLLRMPPGQVPGAIRDSLPQVQLPERRIIAFALDSNEASALRGALDNAGAAVEFFPGWTCRFYVDDSVPPAIREELAGLPNAEVAEGDDGPAELWGLAAARDCDVLLLRSPLARLGLLDVQAVTHWLASDKDLHSVHDHPDHRWDRPTPHLLGLRKKTLQWAAQNAGKAGLQDLVREMPDAWLRHDGQWHLGAPLPAPRVRWMRASHGMMWEANSDYGGLSTPSWEPHLRRLRSRFGWKFRATWLARRLLRPLPERATMACMAGLCRLLYGKPQEPQEREAAGGGG